MSHYNVGIGVSQETKVAEGVYTSKSSGYWAMSSEAPSAHIGGVAVFYHKAENFTLEALCLHGANVVRFQLASGGKW